MNKLFYRIIFSKSLNMLVVVSDIARSHRAGVSPSSGADRKPHATLTATLAPLTFGLLLAFAQVTPAIAGIVADKSAPGHQQPQIINSASGVPQVNIQTPSAAGVSRNTYSEFDVSSKGVILNNSHQNTRTNLAGMVAGNPNLVKGEAKIILNEVNSRDPSKLNGYIETAGSKAQVVIANPSGITCDGCGFVNASRATLTTGTPQLDNGNLTGYRVNGGNITITGGGLDSTGQDYTDIIARSVKVNAGIRANNLNVTAGRNLVDAAHQTITKLADDGSAKPGVAIDVSALGGMYAGKIRLIGTEQGVGVHNAGKIGATAGNVMLTADGRIENSGQISSSADTQITSHSDITNSGGIRSQGQIALSSDGMLTNSGTVASAGSLTATAKTLNSTQDSLLAAGVDDSGKLTKPGDITLTTSGQLAAHGQNLAAGNITLKGNGVDLSHSQTAAQSVSLEAQCGTLSTAGATVDAQTALVAHTTQALINDGGSLTANKLTLSAHDLSNRSGNITQTGRDDLSLTPAGTLDNQGGHIRTNSNNLTLSAATLNNHSGEITHAGKGRLTLNVKQGVDNGAGTVQSAGDLVASAATFDNTDGTLAGTGNVTLNAASLNNQRGSIGTDGDMQLLLSGSLDNRQGKLANSGNLDITTTDLLNTSGVMGSGGLFTLNADSLNNQSGVIKAGETLRFSVSNLLDNSNGGVIGTDGDLQLTTGTLNNAQGQLLANGAGKLVASSLVDNRAGQIAVQSVLDLQAQTLQNDNSGQLQSGGDMSLTAKQISNTGTVDKGGISTSGNLNITSSSLDNTSGLLLAGKSLSLLNTLLTNPDGQIVAQGAATISTTGDLNNQRGVIQGKGVALDTQGHTLSNQSGTLYSLAALTLNSGDINNQGGTLGSVTDTTLTANNLDNRNGGRIVSQQNAKINAQSLLNQQGQIQSAGDLWLKIVSIINNQSGLLRSGATTTLQAQQLNNSSTSGDNKGIEGQNISLTTGTLNNQSGSLLANNNLTLAVDGLLNNTQGLMSASDTLTMDGNALQLTNTGGVASAGSQLSLNALSLTGDGQLLSTGDMNISSQQSFSNQGKLIANNNLTLTTAGDITNSGQLLAGNTLELHGTNLTNQQTGEINGGTDRLLFSNRITNTGLIDGGLTWLEANTLNNSGTGRIYGDSIGVNVTTFNNLPAGGVAPVLAGREQVNIGAQTINNYEHALIYSDGTLAVGGALAADGTVTGRANVINNHSAMIESAGDMLLNVSQLNNINDHFSTELVTVSSVDKWLFQWKGVMYDTDDYTIYTYMDETRILCIEGVVCHNNTADNFNEYKYTETTQETQVKESDPAKILSGGNLTINGDTINNENSEIVAGQTLTNNATTTNNEQAEGQRIITDNGTLKHYYRVHHRGGDEAGVDTSDYTPPATVQTIALQPGRMTENSSFSGSGETIDAQGNRETDVNTGGAGRTDTGVNGSDKAPVAPQPGTQFDVVPENGDSDTVIRTVTPDTRLPDNSLFNVLTDNTRSYLIETDPRFTNGKTWLGSDYMQKWLNYDQAMKRLGDGYYEQRLVREQVIALSGMRYLEGFSSDEEEYKALMDNGIAFYNEYHLKPGVALSVAQMAKLTKPLVWLVNTTVTMPDGSRQTVLVPQVYAPVKAGDLNSSGALMSGNNVVMNLTGDLTNSGVIGSRQATVITAENILNNTGSIQGADVSLTARNDITSIGGMLQGLDSLVANAGRDISLTTTTRSATSHNATSQFSRTTLDKVASISVLNDNSTLVLNAGRDANLTAVQVVNAGNDSQMLINAGRNVNLNTVTTASQDDVVWDKDNTLHQASTRETGTEIAGKGTVSLAAGQDLNVRAASINAGDALNLAAGNNISIVNGINHNEVDERHKKTGTSGIFSSTTTTTRDAFSRDTAQESQLSGNSVNINAGNDLLIKGSDVAGTQDVILHGGHDVTISAADESNQELHFNQTTTSGLTGTGGIGVSYGTQDMKVTDTLDEHTHRGSTVGSSDGNLSISAGNNLAATNSDLIAGHDMALSGKNVSILAAEDDSTATHKVEQKTSGLTLALSGAVGSALNTAVTTAKESKDESNSRISALEKTKAALTGVQAGQAVAMDSAQGNNPDNNNAIGVTLSYGSQSSKSEQKQATTTSQGSSVMAGHDLSIQATDGDINIQGSQLQAGNNALLDASRDIIMKSGENTSALTGKNESKGGTVGIGIGAGSGGWGIQISASVNKASGKETGNGTTHTESTLTAGNNVTLKSGRDTFLTGAQVSGDSVTADVGRDLIMTSEQDSDKYDSKQQSASAGGTFNIGSMSGSASVNLSKDKMHSNYQSVQEQTGIFAGQGGFDVNVVNHTQLNGAVIASNADSSKNSLSTGTLGWNDIHNEADYKVEHQSVGMSTGGSIGGQFVGNAANALLSGLNDSGHDEGTTHAAISAGSITINDKANQKQDVATLDRDTAHANGSIDPIFDKEKEQNRIRENQLISEIGAQATDIATTQGDIEGRNAAKKALAAKGEHEPSSDADKATWDKYEKHITETNEYKAAQKEWGTGSNIQRGIQAVTAGLVGLSGGNVAGAIAGAAAPELANIIGHHAGIDDNPEARAVAHAVLGGIVAELNGGSAAAGAAGAAAGELAADVIAKAMYPDVKPGDLSPDQKDTVTALATIAAGMAGGIAGGDTAGAMSGAQAGKNATQNNYLSNDQKNQKDKEIADCKDSTACQLKVGAKWDAVDVGQQASFGAGMLAGVPAGLVDSVKAIADMGASPVETYEALKSLFNSGDVLGNASDAVKQSYIDRINYMESEYQKAGASGSFNAGVESGKLVADVGSLLAGGAGVVKIGSKVADAGAILTERIASKLKPSEIISSREIPGSSTGRVAELNKVAGDEEAAGWSQYDKYRNESGDWNWPEKLGFSEVPTQATLSVGTRLDRYGNPNGAFLAPKGTPYEQRALAPGARASDYHEYEVIKPLPVMQGKIAPAFGEPGGGVQILPNMQERVDVQWLLDNKYIREVH